MNDTDSPPGGDLDALLDALDAADTALRSMYQRLAEEPDRATEYETSLRELQAKRLDLARAVGLAVLTLKRASAKDADAGDEPPPSAVTPSRPPPIPDEAPPSPDRASDADIAQFTSAVQERGFGRRLAESLSPASAWPLVLHELMATIGPPRDLTDTVSLIDEIDALDAVSDDEHRAQWARSPRPTQHGWLSLLVARTRAVQELPSLTADARARVKVVFRRFQGWSGTHTPGHVNGLQSRHAPLDRTWSHDAESYWDALSESLGDERQESAPSAPAKKAKARSGRGGVAAPALDPSWPLLGVVRGRRALMVGGDPREPNRQRLERAFGFASLEWPEVDGPRAVDAIAERVRRGTYDLVLVLGGFVAHKQSDAIIAACKETPVPFAVVEWGYGVASVKLALDRFLGAREGASGQEPRAVSRGS